MRTLHARRGSAMVIAALLIFILGSLAISLTETTVGNLKGEQRRSEDLALAMASESAANIALDYLQRHSDLLKTDLDAAVRKTQLPTMEDVDGAKPNAELNTTQLGISQVHGLAIGARWCYIGQRAVVKKMVDGLPRLEVVSIGTPDSMTQDVYFIRAWATRGGASDINTWRTRRVEMLFVPYPQEVFVRAMFAHKGYDFQGDAETDSWVSSDGTYTPYARRNGTLGSEGDIYVQKPSNIGGEQNINDFINYPLPPVDYDASLPVESPDILSTSTTLDAASAQKRRYAAINLGSGATLTIKGAVTVYVDGPISIAPHKSVNPIVYADASSRLTLIQNDYDPTQHPEWSGIENTIDQMNGGEAIGDPANPSRFLYISAFRGEMTFNGGASFGGVLFLPNATLKLNGNFDFFGSVIADAFATKSLSADEQGKVMGTFSFHYDESLAKLKLPLPARIGVVGWFTSNPVVGGP